MKFSTKTSFIQVRVRMLNINYGRNEELLNACRPLMDYSRFIDDIRRNTADGLSIESAVDRAVTETPDDSVIKPLLIENKAEVRAMCITEYDEAKTMQMFKEEGREEGLEQGLERGREEGLEQGLEQGREEGLENGIKSIVAYCQKVNGNELDVIEAVVANYGITEEKARVLIKKYW